MKKKILFMQTYLRKKEIIKLKSWQILLTKIVKFEFFLLNLFLPGN